MRNRRFFYPAQGVKIGPDGNKEQKPLMGLNSVSMQTNFNLEQVFGSGSMEIFDYPCHPFDYLKHYLRTLHGNGSY